MAKITLPTVESGYLSTEALNDAFEQISTAIDNTLSRDGSTPNTMEADLDMNGYRIINVSTDVSNEDSFCTVGDMQDYVDEHATGLIVQRLEQHTATAAQTVFTLTSMTYDVGSNNLAVYVDGVRKFPTLHYTETSESTVTFLSGQSVGAKVTFITNDFLATVELPAHEHPWEQITGLPSYATRWPTYDEVTGKPSTFTPASHEHSASDITSGRLADARRGVYVQATQPTSPQVGDLWFW